MLGPGNLRIDFRPSLVVASRSAIGRLVSAGYTEGAPEGLYQDRGVVLLVKKGNSEGIRSVFDLARPGVRLVTPNPRLEPGAFQSCLATLYGIASNDAHPPPGMTAARLTRLASSTCSSTVRAATP